MSGGLFSELELLENRTKENKLQKLNSRKTKRKDEIFITLKQNYNYSSINGGGRKRKEKKLKEKMKFLLL